MSDNTRLKGLAKSEVLLTHMAKVKGNSVTYHEAKVSYKDMIIIISLLENTIQEWKNNPEFDTPYCSFVLSRMEKMNKDFQKAINYNYEERLAECKGKANKKESSMMGFGTDGFSQSYNRGLAENKYK